ncbi:DUF4097 family beta strand repeat-containing protein [Ornithinibacillus scapharcae]|uniref:DUF4097 family beta strand repeat-containing protein n=1 Tax=Ornithinibacillus scapharcae TaxID=1147159 RepID=UPI000225AB7A|nr:DUF4097 family beta strand repeat-containing protein [Ornithinibacillus scapharcae]
MPKQKLLILVASCLLIVGAIGSITTYRTSDVSAEDLTDTEIIENANLTQIEIETENAKIEVLPTDEKNIKLEFTAPASEYDKYKLKLEEAGDTLSIELKEKRIRFLYFDTSFDFTGPVLKLYLPQKQYEELNIDGVNGRIDVKQIEVAYADIETINGKIELEELTTVETEVSSENGGIELHHVDGNISSEVTNGSTLLVTDNLERSIDLESVNGKITIQSSKEPTNATIEVSVVNGKVNIFGDNARVKTYGDGKHHIKVETVNGGVTFSN